VTLASLATGRAETGVIWEKGNAVNGRHVFEYGSLACGAVDATASFLAREGDAG
jgi:hypothetical protein